MGLSCAAVAWDFWAPGTALEEQDPAQLDDSTRPISPELKHVKPMQRRRLTPVARAAFQAAQIVSQPVPCVFISTYGQPNQTLAMLRSLAADEPVSPAKFSTSVHNAVAGLFSIINQCEETSISLAAGSEGLSIAIIEAIGILTRGAPQVLVTAFEEALPEAFKPYQSNPPNPMAISLLLEARGKGAFDLKLERETISSATAIDNNLEPLWQQMVRCIEFLNSDQPQLTLPAAAAHWHWRR